MLLTNTINAEIFAEATFAGYANACGCELRSGSARFVSPADVRLRLMPSKRLSVDAMRDPRGGGLHANIMGRHSWPTCSPAGCQRLSCQAGIGRVN